MSKHHTVIIEAANRICLHMSQHPVRSFGFAQDKQYSLEVIQNCVVEVTRVRGLIIAEQRERLKRNEAVIRMLMSALSKAERELLRTSNRSSVTKDISRILTG